MCKHFDVISCKKEFFYETHFIKGIIKCSKNEKIKLNNLGISAQLDLGPIPFWWQKKYEEIQNNQKLNNKQEWLIEINHAKDELEKYDFQQLKKFLSNQKSSPKTSDVRSVKQIRNKTNNFKNP